MSNMKPPRGKCIELTPELLRHKEDCFQRWQGKWQEAGVIATRLIARHTFKNEVALKRGAIRAAQAPDCKTTLNLIYQQLKKRRPKNKD